MAGLVRTGGILVAPIALGAAMSFTSAYFLTAGNLPASFTVLLVRQDISIPVGVGLGLGVGLLVGLFNGRRGAGADG